MFLPTSFQMMCLIPISAILSSRRDHLSLPKQPSAVPKIAFCRPFRAIIKATVGRGFAPACHLLSPSDFPFAFAIA